MNKEEALKLVNMPLKELLRSVEAVRENNPISNIELCGIVNAKSGICTENCKFCAQSSHYNVDISEYPLISKEMIVDKAIESSSNGSKRFGIVTSGNKLTKEEINIIADSIKAIIEETDVIPCASLGALSSESFKILRDAGLNRYHHNIETSEKYYKEIVNTHDYSERVNTVSSAKKCGLEVCSGGIIGMGETWEDRIDMAFLLKELNVDSVPLNMLVPIEGTPMFGMRQILPSEAIRTIALFRMILQDKVIKVAAGRETVFTDELIRSDPDKDLLSICDEKGLNDPSAIIFLAGANGMMIGGYLTIAGRSVQDDLALVSEMKKHGFVGSGD